MIVEDQVAYCVEHLSYSLYFVCVRLSEQKKLKIALYDEVESKYRKSWPVYKPGYSNSDSKFQKHFDNRG